MKLLILYAVDTEASQLLQRFSLEEKQIQGCFCWHGRVDNTDVYIARTGIGTTRAAVITTRLSLALKPDVIFYMGTAGGLTPGINIGDMFIGEKIVDADLVHLTDVLKGTPFASGLIEPQQDIPIQFIYQLDAALLTQLLTLDFPRISLGTIATSSTFPAPKDALDVMKNLNSNVIEMEGSGVCYAAYLEGIPLVIIRVVSNNLDIEGNDLGTSDKALDICATRLADFMMLVLANMQVLQGRPALIA